MNQSRQRDYAPGEQTTRFVVWIVFVLLTIWGMMVSLHHLIIAAVNESQGWFVLDFFALLVCVSVFCACMEGGWE